MTDQQCLTAISVNLLRIAEWYYKNPQQNAALCQRYLEQSLELGTQVRVPEAQEYVQRLQQLSLGPSDESVSRIAERFLTLGVLLQHPERWLR